MQPCMRSYERVVSPVISQAFRIILHILLILHLFPDHLRPLPLLLHRAHPAHKRKMQKCRLPSQHFCGHESGPSQVHETFQPSDPHDSSFVFFPKLKQNHVEHP